MFSIVRFSWYLVVMLAGLLFGYGGECVAQSRCVPLIPRRILFDSPDKAAVQISPDGRYLSYLAPWKGVLNLWIVRATEAPGAPTAKRVTNMTHRSLADYQWTYSGHLAYSHDTEGDENWRLFLYDVATDTTREIGQAKGAITSIAATSWKKPHEVIISTNQRDKQWFDLYHLDVRNGAKTLVLRNTMFEDYVFDEDLNLKLATAHRDDGGRNLYRRQGHQWSVYDRLGVEDNVTVCGWTGDGQRMYCLDNRGRDKAALASIHWLTGHTRWLAIDDKADVEGIDRHPTKGTIESVIMHYDKAKRCVLDKAIMEDCRWLDHMFAPSQWQVVSRTLDNATWVVSVYGDQRTTRYYLVKRCSRQATFLFSVRPQLDHHQLAPMRPVVIKARDGLPMMSYVTWPIDQTSRHSRRKDRPIRPLPMVLLVHGGPWSRDAWGLNAIHQWLANRGYAVLSVNFRGSTGFGKHFLKAGHKQWGRRMHTDLLDAVGWAVKNKIAIANKVAIMGASYGGYATLVGLTLTPDVFACGVDIVGISNMHTFIKTIPPHWKPAMNMMKKCIGDWDNPQESQALKEVSPIHRAHAITKPLLIAQGAHDPRVNREESEQMVRAMRAHHISVIYALYTDEGHGLNRPDNNRSLYAMIEVFLGRILGGRVEPVEADLLTDALVLNGIKTPTAAHIRTIVKEGVGAPTALLW